MTERLTIQFTAVMHGDSEIITEGATLEAGVKEELIPLVIEWMEECTQGFRDRADPVTPEGLREKASQLLTRASELEGRTEPATKVDAELPEDVRQFLGEGWEPLT